MKSFKNFSIIISVVLLAVGFGIVGYAGKDTVYAEYEASREGLPYMTNFFMGLHDGITPLSIYTGASTAKGYETASAAKGYETASADENSEGTNKNNYAEGDRVSLLPGNGDDSHSDKRVKDSHSQDDVENIDFVYSGILDPGKGTDPDYDGDYNRNNTDGVDTYNGDNNRKTEHAGTTGYQDYANTREQITGPAKRPVRPDGSEIDTQNDSEYKITADSSDAAGKNPSTIEISSTYNPRSLAISDGKDVSAGNPRGIGMISDSIPAAPDSDTHSSKAFIKVEQSYLDDALFIGDSRVVGLSEYGDLKNATFYAFTGINVFKLFSKKFCETPMGTVDLATALSARQFGKIYLQVGINELGSGDTAYFIDAYSSVIERIRELQPDALIFIQGILRVSKKKENKTFNNEKINERNAALAELADNDRIFYLEVNDAISDEEGYMRAELSFDGVHMYAKHYHLWTDYLLNHGIGISQ